MGFLDNSGDIILDAVLTDTGRYRLARGDGSFKITQFALGDDEIDYGLYDKSHASGSAYYDLEILQTPVLEAFTNNKSMLKSKLVSYAKKDMLYMPIIKISEVADGSKTKTSDDALALGSFVVACDKDTEDLFAVTTQGLLKGVNPHLNSNYIRLDQGLDTTEINGNTPLPAEMVEQQYLMEMDTRLGSIVSADNAQRASLSFVDDDAIGTYYITSATNSNFVKKIKPQPLATSGVPENMAISGPRGTFLHFKIRASLELQTNTFLFTKLGGTITYASQSVRYIDSVVRVVGGTTGYKVDIPVRFIKKI